MSARPPFATFLYTQDLRGDLRFLPKLARRLMALRLEEPRTLTLDLGGSCSPDVWHCAATEGRSMLIALDGLNYTAVNAAHMPEHVRPSLIKSLVNLQAVNAARPGHIPGARFYTQPPAEDPQDDALQLILVPAPAARVTDQRIEFPAVDRYSIGRMRVRTAPPVELVSVETIPVPPETLPDPTISGMVDFIESEARLYQRRGKT